MNIVKYLGGKEKEIPAIMGSMPAEIGSYYDPFVGGVFSPVSGYDLVKALRYRANYER